MPCQDTNILQCHGEVRGYERIAFELHYVGYALEFIWVDGNELVRNSEHRNPRLMLIFLLHGYRSVFGPNRVHKVAIAQRNIPDSCFEYEFWMKEELAPVHQIVISGFNG